LLYMQIRSQIKHRSLLVLFTNIESLSGLHRQLNYLRPIATHHLMMVVFFENTELHQLTHLHAANIEEVYIKTVAEKFEFEKRLIVKELKKHGILSILTAPEHLTINTVNKYLELNPKYLLRWKSGSGDFAAEICQIWRGCLEFETQVEYSDFLEADASFLIFMAMTRVGEAELRQERESPLAPDSRECLSSSS